MNKKNTIAPIGAYFLLSVFLFACSNSSQNTRLVVVNDYGDTVSVSNTAPNNAASSDQNNFNEKLNEKIAEKAVDLVAETGEYLIKKYLTSDSTIQANKNELFGYSLGFEMSREKAIDAYRQLGDKTNIYIFRKDRKTYRLIKFENKSESELQLQLSTYQKNIGESLLQPIDVINLSDLCKRNKTLKLDNDLVPEGDTLSIPCLICKKK